MIPAYVNVQSLLRTAFCFSLIMKCMSNIQKKNQHHFSATSNVTQEHQLVCTKSLLSYSAEKSTYCNSPTTHFHSFSLAISFLLLRSSNRNMKPRGLSKPQVGGFPGGAVVENLPANAGDTGSSPDLGRSHMPRSNQAREPQLLSP